MAYAAVISVFNAIKDLLDSPRITTTSSTHQILLSACDQDWLVETLSKDWCSKVVTASDDEGMIIEEARRLQDAIESAVSTQLLEQSKICKPAEILSLNLDHLEQDVERFVEMGEKMEGRIEELWEQKVEEMIEQHIVEICVPQNDEEEDVSASSATEMVGLSNEFQRLRDDLAIPATSGYMITWISGMAGVGKTTFVKRVYNDPLVKANFECCAFVRVGRECWREQILRSLYTQLNHGHGHGHDHQKMMKEGDYEDILKGLIETLKTKKFLIVLDDVWDDYIFKYLLEHTINVHTGARILVTSRKVEDSIFYEKIELRFLNEDESWELLRRKVFGEERCPPLLVEAGKKIAKKCGGLPLLINALAPILLEKAEKDTESWKRIAEKPNSVLEEASLQISEVLLPSYNQLEEIFKLCFLYVTAFPEGYVVFCSMINNLWHAEGFTKFIAEKVWGIQKSGAFVNLVENNLVIAGHRESWTSYEVQACSLHCVYWYVNKRVAKDNRFMYIMNSYADGMDDVVQSHHRLGIQTNVLLAIEEVFGNIASISTVRSVLCTGLYNQYEVPICFEWKMLRVLDVVTIRFYEFPLEVVTLVLLRYLALTCNANIPPSISKLLNLQFLIVRQHWRIKRVGVESFVPVEVWDLQELIHLEIVGRNLPHPPHPGAILPNLIKLLDVGVESCSEGVLGNIPNLEKLRIQIELSHDAALDLICLSDVKSFQCVVMNPTLLRPPPPLSVPTVLEGVIKLSLSGLGYPWEEMSQIAKLPYLRVLKLRSYAFRGEKWEVNEEMRFISLEYLYIEDTDLVEWTGTAEKNLQSLMFLKLKNCHRLHEITRLSSYGLNIELIDCNPLAEICAKQIHGSDGEFTVTATYSWKEKELNSP